MRGMKERCVLSLLLLGAAVAAEEGACVGGGVSGCDQSQMLLSATSKVRQNFTFGAANFSGSAIGLTLVLYWWQQATANLPSVDYEVAAGNSPLEARADVEIQNVQDLGLVDSFATIPCSGYKGSISLATEPKASDSVQITWSLSTGYHGLACYSANTAAQVLSNGVVWNPIIVVGTFSVRLAMELCVNALNASSSSSSSPLLPLISSSSSQATPAISTSSTQMLLSSSTSLTTIIIEISAKNASLSAKLLTTSAAVTEGQVGELAIEIAEVLGIDVGSVTVVVVGPGTVEVTIASKHATNLVEIINKGLCI